MALKCAAVSLTLSVLYGLLQDFLPHSATALAGVLLDPVPPQVVGLQHKLRCSSETLCYGNVIQASLSPRCSDLQVFHECCTFIFVPSAGGEVVLVSHLMPERLRPRQ